ncbi:MAG: glycine--tRNA ligase subunit beta [Actinobacteria bacterium]|nr:glycine--tRNA ligase subunit beta [Actinomycetota bacterium]
MKFKKFLLEIGTEEMPYWAVYDGISYLEKSFSDTFEENKLQFSNLKVYGGPRRFAVLADVGEKQEDRIVKVKGPAYKSAFTVDGSPTNAAIGFAKSQGVNVEDLLIEEVNGGTYVFAVKELKGRDAKEFLSEAIPSIIKQMKFKKSMRWGNGTFWFIRPIRWIVALLDDEIIEFEVAGVASGRETRGHRILSKKEIQLNHASEYIDTLSEKGKVLVDHNERKRKIVEDSIKEAAVYGGEPIINEETLKEVVQLVEWPSPLVGEFDESFLSLPSEVLITVMQHHQRYFPIKQSSGRLMNRFIVIQNGDPLFGNEIREGNERVVRARLEDARFFYEEDLKIKLEERVPKLKGVVFQKKLGNLYDKTLRNVDLAIYLSKELGSSDETIRIVERAAYLAKADLLTEMVNEFDELQGYMGKEYALKQGEPEEVAEAIYEHYLPRYFGDELPKTEAGKILSIADKLDTVCGYFLAGLEPTGSEDPYSLRRQAQGVCAVVLSTNRDLDLKKVILRALSLYSGIEGLLPESETFERLCGFFESRYQRILIEKGFMADIVSAVLPQILERPASSIKKAEIISRFFNTSELEDVCTAYQRVKNLAKPELGTEYNDAYLEEEEEINLAKKISELAENFHTLDYENQFLELSRMRPYIDNFFDNVLVMHEDRKVRENRLKLLNKTLLLFNSYAEFSALK